MQNGVFCNGYICQMLIFLNFFFFFGGGGVIFDNLPVIRQKGESQNRCFKKTKMPNFSKSKHFLLADMHTHMWKEMSDGSAAISFFF